MVLSGSLGYRAWEAKDGSKRSKVELVVRDAVTQREDKGASRGSAQSDVYDEDIPF